ncbi:MAG: 7TM diverse intracellular signaling domain-containing protein [Fulvivirga sp.]|nr:7TM diverse intracellular signaling domain-containing protein [Fulvivirga sp.]
MIRIRLLLIGLFFLASLLQAWATDTLAVNSIEEKSLTKYFQYYIDESGEKSFEDIRKISFSSDKEGEPLRLDVSEAHVWLKLAVKSNISSQEKFVIEFDDPSLFHIVLYEIAQDTIILKRSGAGVPPEEKEAGKHKNNFLINIKPGEIKTFYFEISSKTSMTLSARLQHEDVAVSKYFNEHTALGIFYGFLLLLSIFSVLLAFTTRYAAFLYYALYVLSIAGFSSAADGFMAKYLHRFILITQGYHDIFFYILGNLLGLLFMQKFLNTKDWRPKLHRWVNIYMFLLTASVLVTFLVSKQAMLFTAEIYGLLTVAIYIYTGSLAVKNKIEQAYYYLLAYIAFGIFVIIFVLSQLRIIPFSFIVQYAVHFGYAISMIILAYGLILRLYALYEQLLLKEKEKQEIIRQKNKELETKVAERTAEITQKEINLRSILDNTDNSIWLIDENYKIIEFNKVFATLWSTTFSRKLKRGENILSLIPQKELKSTWESRYKDGLEGESHSYIDTFYIEGNESYFETKAYPIREGGTIRGIAFFSKDITAKLKAEKQLKAQNKMLKKVNKELDSFVYSASHDLKAPLASVLGLINLVKSEKDLNNRLHYYEMMEKSVVRLDTFIKDIIDYSRNERTSLHAKKIDLQELIESVFEDLKYFQDVEAIKKNIHIQVDRPVYTDEMRLKVVIRNLVSNAIKYGCSPDVKNKQIDLTAEENDNTINLVVRDYGNGIPGENKERIFDMFFRAHENAAGTGLGLYIVKETVEKLQGSISFESSHQGTSFFITIPLEIKNLTAENF